MSSSRQMIGAIIAVLVAAPLTGHGGIEDDAIDRIGGFQKFAHQGTTRGRANAIVMDLKDVDDYVPDVTVIIDD
jgi:hypothetical protein